MAERVLFLPAQDGIGAVAAQRRGAEGLRDLEVSVAGDHVAIGPFLVSIPAALRLIGYLSAAVDQHLKMGGTTHG